MGAAGVGKTSICSLIFSIIPQYLPIQKKNNGQKKKAQQESKFMGKYNICIWDLGGSYFFDEKKEDSFTKKILKDVEILVFIFDISEK